MLQSHKCNRITVQFYVAVAQDHAFTTANAGQVVQNWMDGNLLSIVHAIWSKTDGCCCTCTVLDYHIGLRFQWYRM